MTKEEAISILKRKIEKSKEAAKEKHFDTLTQIAISNYEHGKVQGLYDALSIIGMINESNR